MKRPMAGRGGSVGGSIRPQSFQVSIRRLQDMLLTALAMRFPIDLRGSSVLVAASKAAPRAPRRGAQDGTPHPPRGLTKGPLIEDPWGHFVELQHRGPGLVDGLNTSCKVTDMSGHIPPRWISSSMLCNLAVAGVATPNIMAVWPSKPQRCRPIYSRQDTRYSLISVGRFNHVDKHCLHIHPTA